MTTTYSSYIKKLREDKGISQSHLADHLGIARTSYIAIEQGKRELTITEFEKISDTLDVSLEELKHEQKPDYAKYRHMIHAFLKHNSGLPKTKLAKLLYFADFVWYYTHLKSMSGMQYRKIQYGPVADSYFRLIDEMFDSGEIDIETTDSGAMMISQTRAGQKEKLNSLTKEELTLIEKIDKKWKGRRTDEIVKFTHNQLPYIFAEDNEIVSYDVFGQENPEDIY